VSLHAAIPTVRDELVPLNRRYDLQRLQDACEYWDEKTKRRISFEYALIDGVNDTDEAARALAEYASPLRAHINLIPLNPTPGYLVRGSSMARVHAFRDALEIRGLNVSVRDTRGRSIAAACGQLAQVTRGKRSAVRLGRSLIPEVGEDASE
jgi:23S rRNA (adenine2503-C2)-methyltransferase